MCTVKITVLRNHLRFNPDTELHAQVVNLLYQGGKASMNLLFVHIPISQTGDIIIPLAKPPIIKNKQFNADLLSGFGNSVKLFLIKVKVGGFPVVYQHRTVAVYMGAADQMLAEGVMEVMGNLL